MLSYKPASHQLAQFIQSLAEKGVPCSDLAAREAKGIKEEAAN